MLNNFILPFQSVDNKNLIPVSPPTTGSPSPSPYRDDLTPYGISPEYEKIKKRRPIISPYIRPESYDILGRPNLEALEPLFPREGVAFQYGPRRVYGPSTNQYNSINSGIRMNIMKKLIQNGATVHLVDNNTSLVIVRDKINLPLIEQFSNRTWQTYNSIARGVETDDSNIMFCACPSTKGLNTDPLEIGRVYTLSKGNSVVKIVISHIFTNSNDPKIKHYWGYLSKI